MGVCLDAANPAAPLLEVVDNSADTLTVESPQDLSAAVGRELIGVYDSASTPGDAR